MVKRIIDASALLQEATRRHNIHLSLLVASTGIWAHPNVHGRWLRESNGGTSGKTRRYRPGQKEKVGQVIDGVRLDNNTYANNAIKRATGLGRSADGFETCHIWPKTCYDERYHTAPANLVLLPRAIASLSDHDLEVQQALQYRSFELYGWWPEGEVQPGRPEFYPTEWREPEPDPTKAPKKAGERAQATRDWSTVLPSRIVGWSRKPHQVVHKIIALVVQSPGGISRPELVRRADEVSGSTNAYGAVSQLLTTRGNPYGPALIDRRGTIHLHPDFEGLVRSLRWTLE